MKCPRDHVLPNSVGGVSCGLDYCGEQAESPFKDVGSGKEVKKKKASPPGTPTGQVGGSELTIDHKKARAITAEVKRGAVAATSEFLDEALKGTELSWAAKADAEEARAEQIAKLGRQIGRYEARKIYTKTPEAGKLSVEEAKDFVEKKLGELTLDAVSRIEFDLKLGDDDVSRKAAYEVLDRTGFGRKDGGGIAGAPIIIVNNAGGDGPVTYRPAFLDGSAVKK